MDYAIEVNGDIDFALRGVNDGQLYSVQNVDFNYLLQQFNIAIPSNTTYTIGGLSTTSLEAGEVVAEPVGEALIGIETAHYCSTHSFVTRNQSQRTEGQSL